MKNPTRALTLLALASIPSLAHAHTGVGPAHGLGHGLTHPLLGIDHLLAMVAIGLWAAQQGGLKIWILPAAFLSAMTLGAIAGVNGIPLPAIEPMIAFSGILLGVLVAIASKPPLAVSILLAAGFGLFHGHAHGAEMPMDSSALAYGAGFLVSTAILHAAGIGLGLLPIGSIRPQTLRIAGASITLVAIATTFLG